ncbi:ABC transporter substrate-binding protein [Litorilituus sediminis]|uniref:ABC transporter substrate-binding protein n=1 Tax=Litorilituus sediminis TaxID=718192 RepID=A0A4P6P788_9GAMM|nr:ABC transporter substrate-binding protein [Litorilituus sediminis]QBG37616.1 ABC transporter substrate-binding protein [Litorilituus sediminis]
MLKLAVLLVLIFYVADCIAEQGVSAKKIKLGMSNALTGPAAKLGLELKKGSLAYFHKLNKTGGIHGREVELISLDDAYEPIHTVANTHQLIAKQVFALFGYVGTPTSHAVMSIIKYKQIPYLMPFTGAKFLRTPTQKNIFNLRASYAQEAQVQVNYLVEKQHFKNIALVIQADEFGLAAEAVFTQSLSSYNLNPVVVARFQRNSNDIDKVLVKLLQQPVDAVIFVGTYQPFTSLINQGFAKGFNPYYSSLSFIASKEVFSELSQPSKILITEVVPNPDSCQWQVCKQFRADMKSAGHNELNRIQFEGYLNALVFAQAAKQCAIELNRECLIAQLEQFSLSNLTMPIQFSANNHQGSQQVYLSLSDAVN